MIRIKNRLEIKDFNRLREAQKKLLAEREVANKRHDREAYKNLSNELAGFTRALSVIRDEEEPAR